MPHACVGMDYFNRFYELRKALSQSERRYCRVESFIQAHGHASVDHGTLIPFFGSTDALKNFLERIPTIQPS